MNNNELILSKYFEYDPVTNIWNYKIFNIKLSGDSFIICNKYEPNYPLYFNTDEINFNNMRKMLDWDEWFYKNTNKISPNWSYTYDDDIEFGVGFTTIDILRRTCDEEFIFNSDNTEIKLIIEKYMENNNLRNFLDELKTINENGIR